MGNESFVVGIINNFLIRYPLPKELFPIQPNLTGFQNLSGLISD